MTNMAVAVLDEVLGNTFAPATGLAEGNATGNENTEASDYALAQCAAVGDTGSFEQLYRRHASRVYGICLRMTTNVAEAEDLTQEVFIQLYRKIGSFQGRSAFTTWLHRLTVNQVLMHFRKRRSRPESATVEDETPR